MGEGKTQPKKQILPENMDLRVLFLCLGRSSF